MRSRLGLWSRFGWVLVGFLLVAIVASCMERGAAASVQPAAAPAPASRVADPIRIPPASARLRTAVIREAQRLYGLDAPVARFAAQIHQESRWNATAASRFAHGLAQFTPPTADWIAQAYPELRPAAPWDAHWSIRAMVRYMHHIGRTLPPGKSDCDTWAFALSGYNGGPGWVGRDRRLALAAHADPDRWFGHVEHYTNRAGWAKSENRGYVRRILLTIEPEYIAAGWPGHLACPSETALAGFGVS